MSQFCHFVFVADYSNWFILFHFHVILPVIHSIVQGEL
jgi:hypothetical protein